MPLTHHQTDLLLVDLERRVRGRSSWRGYAVFYQVLDYDLQPILDTAADPDYVRAWVRSMLERNGHVPDPPASASSAPSGFSRVANG